MAAVWTRSSSQIKKDLCLHAVTVDETIRGSEVVAVSDKFC